MPGCLPSPGSLWRRTGDGAAPGNCHCGRTHRGSGTNANLACAADEGPNFHRYSNLAANTEAYKDAATHGKSRTIGYTRTYCLANYYSVPNAYCNSNAHWHTNTAAIPNSHRDVDTRPHAYT